MPRPNSDEKNRRRDEREKLRKQRIRQSSIERGNRQTMLHESKILSALIERPLSYTELMHKTRFEPKPLKNYLKKLKNRESITKVAVEGKKRELYALTKVSCEQAFKFLAISFLVQSLTNDPINEFNQHLGSLITYTLKQYKMPQAMSILIPIIVEIEDCINLPKTIYGWEVLKKEPNVESNEWELWRDIDSRNYVQLTEVSGKRGGIVKREGLNYAEFEKKWLKKN
jgi:hypothetical protein